MALVRFTVPVVSAFAALVLAAPAAHAAYDGELYPDHSSCSQDAAADEAETADTTADTATCHRLSGDNPGDLWQITITPRPWLNEPGDPNADPNDFVGGFIQGFTSASASN